MKAMPRLATVTALAVLLAGCSADAPGIDQGHPWAEELNLALEQATTDFEREALGDGVITREEYEEGYRLWLECVEQVFPPGGVIQVRLEPNDQGGYHTMIDGITSDEELDEYDRIHTACMDGTIAQVAWLYNDMSRNPDNIPFSELLFACLEREGLIPEGYTGTDLERDLIADFDQRNPLSPLAAVSPSEGLIHCQTTGWFESQ